MELEEAEEEEEGEEGEEGEEIVVERTEMSACLNQCLMLFAMEPTKWVFRSVQMASSSWRNF